MDAREQLFTEKQRKRIERHDTRFFRTHARMGPSREGRALACA